MNEIPEDVALAIKHVNEWWKPEPYSERSQAADAAIVLADYVVTLREKLRIAEKLTMQVCERLANDR